MEEYRFERLNEDNINDLIPLYKDAFNQDRTIEEIRKKFDTDIFGAKNIAYLAYDIRGEVAAFYALFPIEITYQKTVYLAAQVGDLMTHSNHRRKGLFLKLAEKTHELATKEGIQIIFTFPYKDITSFDGFIKELKFIHFNDFNEYNIKVNSIPLLFIANKNNFFKIIYRIYFSIIISFYKKYATFINNNINNEVGEIRKDKKIFSYKTYSKSYILSFSDIRVWFKINKNSIFIGDIERVKNFNLQKTLKGLKRLANILGIRHIQFEVSPNSFLDKEFNKYFDYANMYHICYYLIDKGIPLDKINFVSGDIDSF